jgi:hypothetical protein
MTTNYTIQMFSLIHYFPRHSFTGLLLPHTQFLLKELRTNKNSGAEILNIDNYLAYLRRNNSFIWEGQAFSNKLGVTSIIKKDNNPLYIREEINITIKNHIEFDITLDYSLELLDDLQKEPKLLMTMNRYKYVPNLGNINTPILTNVYPTEFVEQYNSLESTIANSSYGKK